MQFRSVRECSSTSWTKDRHDRFRGEFSALHSAMMQDCAAERMLTIAQVPSFAKRGRSNAVFYRKMIKSDHLSRVEW